MVTQKEFDAAMGLVALFTGLTLLMGALSALVITDAKRAVGQAQQQVVEADAVIDHLLEQVRLYEAQEPSVVVVPCEQPEQTVTVPTFERWQVVR